MLKEIKALQKQIINVDDFNEKVCGVFGKCYKMYKSRQPDCKDLVMVYQCPEKENVCYMFFLTVLEYERVKVNRVSICHKDMVEKQASLY